MATSPETRELSMKEIQDHLGQLIAKKKTEDEEVFRWITSNVGDRCHEPGFVRALVTSVCTSAISGNIITKRKVNKAVMISRSAMLKKYVDHKPHLELQTLYTLQALVHRMNQPAGILKTFFDILYNEDIISQDTFTEWETSKYPAEQAGKEAALKSVAYFFTLLRESDENLSLEEDCYCG